MTQANNRQGQGGGELVPFIEGGAAPRLDRVARWGGTESNRARWGGGAHGPDVLGVYLDGQCIAGATMDRVEVGVGVDHVSGPDMTARQVVAIGLGGERIAVPVDPNATAAQMAQAVATALGSRWEAEGNVVRQREHGSAGTTAHTATGGPIALGASDGSGARPAPRHDPGVSLVATPQPDPAPGQVWLPPPVTNRAIPIDVDGTVTVSAIQDYGHWVAFVGGGGIEHCEMTMGPGWTCIGVATPHGRVMVGDGFADAPDDQAPVRATVEAITVYRRLTLGGHVDVPGVVVRLDSGERYTWDAEELFEKPQTRTRYAPARAGERYKCQRTGRVLNGEPGISHDPAQWERLDAAPARPHANLPTPRALLPGESAPPAALPSLIRDGWKAEVRSNAITPGDNGARFVMHVTSPSGRTFAGPFDQWNVIVPGAKPQSAAELADFLGFCMAGVEAEGQAPAVGSTIRIKRPASVVEAERARATGAADAESDVALRDRCIAAEWRRAFKAPGLDTAKGAALDAIAATMGVERRPSAEPSRAIDAIPGGYYVPALDARVARQNEAVRVSFTIKGVAETAAAFQRIEAAAAALDARPSLTLAAPATDLRALFDAIGRALELPATRHACPFGAGLTVTVLRDEMLFTPTAETGIGTADFAADARALCALRSTVGVAMASGRGALPQWGAKGPRVEVVREGPAMVAAPAPEPAEAVRYTPTAGGADAWRWEV